jgi:hypothetical protein
VDEILGSADLRARSEELGLGFTPRDQVRWLAPAQLLRTALQVAIAAAFSTVADKRELQRSFPAEPQTAVPDADGGIWLDYTADTGDGFDATTTVASLLAADRIDVGGEALPRGRLLVLGGDEVYPTGSSQQYDDRLKGPLALALPPPGATDDSREPGLLALPGNHDWYDGLTAFLRVFAQRRRAGGWRTVQDRSYWVVQLPGRWWLVGLDSQLGSEIDDPQLDYFRTHLTAHLQEGDGVVLCVAAPTWVRSERNPTAFDSLHYFERTVVTNRVDEQGRTRATGARVRLWLTGDLHHFAHYEQDGGDGAQLLTCGLGGAYLSSTHRLPETLVLPPPGSREIDRGPARRFRLAGTWPTRAESARTVRGLLAPGSRGLPMRNPGFLGLAVGVHAVLYLMLVMLLGVVRDTGPVRALRDVPVADVARLGAQLGLVWALGAAAVAVRASLRARKLRVPGLIPGGIGLQLLVGVLSLTVTAWLVQLVALPGWFPGGRSLPDFVLLLVAVVLAAGAGGLVGSYAVALTLVLARDERVADVQFSAQAIEGRKGFLRIHVTPDAVTVHPIGVRDVCRRWRTVPLPDAVPGTPRVRVFPAQALRPERIAAPITVPRLPARERP